jgi:hypothetical protein
LKKPDVNCSIGTDNPKRSKLKNLNNTELSIYLRPNKGSKTVPGAENDNLIKFMEWPDESGIGVELNKMSPITLVAFGLGWYLSDTLTRDEKQSWQRGSRMMNSTVLLNVRKHLTVCPVMVGRLKNLPMMDYSNLH